MKYKNYFEIITSIFIKLNIFLLFLFARTFTGVEIFGFLYGELLIGMCALLLVFYYLVIPIIKFSFLENNKLNVLIIFLVTSFIFMNLFSKQSFLNLEIYKTSTYIWSFGGFVLGKIFVKFNLVKINSSDVYLALFGLFAIFIFSTNGISENRQNFLLNFTDKFEYPKGSDLLLAFIFIFYFILNKYKFSRSSINILILFSSLYLPLFLVKSRSGFISLTIFLLLIFINHKSKLFKLDKQNLILFFTSVFIFLLSTSWVVGKDIVVDEEITQELKFAITSRYSTINDNAYEEEYLQLSLFYIENNRLFSTDGNLNWRFQIWQDILQDLTDDNKFLLGYGFSDIIPAMDSDQRYGQDKQNINVHNYFMHILSRGGLLHLVLILGIYFSIYYKFNLSKMKLDYFMIVFPLIFNSLFDPSMENAHYSTIMYFLLGLLVNKSILFKEEV